MADRPQFEIPDVPLDGLLRRAAWGCPERLAIRADAGDITFADLDTAATQCAMAITSMLGRSTATVGVAAALDPAFAVAYYGIARSGNVIAIINPLLRERTLEHIVAMTGIGLVFATPEMCRRLAAAGLSRSGLETVVIQPDGSAGIDDLVTLDGLLAAAGPGADDPRPRTGADPGADAVACIQFTSGTTGDPKGVRLTHRNLTANAAQTAQAHGLTGSCVTVNHLPTYHPMHLNSAVFAAATQVLCANPDVAASVELANRVRATHLYSLPVRLARLAADPRLPDLRLDTVTGILSGGSALSQASAQALRKQFGIPVIQGYGLAETSPLTHCDSLSAPRAGSVGPAVAGTGDRVVDVDSRVVLPPRRQGEVQVRGPQLMLGYLGQASRSDIDKDGWFSTGDVGYLDEDGYLFLVDRIKDVFKCDNWLVAPSEIERVLAAHPAVNDCVVVGRPDPVSGSVAHAIAVLGDGAGDLGEIMTFVNDQVPYYQRLKSIEVLDVIPRSATGKAQRRELADAEWVRSRRGQVAEGPSRYTENRSAYDGDSH